MSIYAHFTVDITKSFIQLPIKDLEEVVCLAQKEMERKRVFTQEHPTLPKETLHNYIARVRKGEYESFPLQFFIECFKIQEYSNDLGNFGHSEY